MQTSTQEYPKCPKCGNDVYSRGHEIFAKPPHKRRKYSCKTCGHPFAEKIVEPTQEGKVIMTAPSETQ